MKHETGPSPLDIKAYQERCKRYEAKRQQPAYNYDTQQWVEDDALYLRQLEDHIGVLESDQGADYAAFIGSPYPDCLETARACKTAILAKIGGTS